MINETHRINASLSRAALVLLAFPSYVALSSLPLKCVAVVEHNAIPHHKGTQDLNHEINFASHPRKYFTAKATMQSDDLFNTKKFM